MAKCEKLEIKPEPPPVEYVLTLTKDEASQLKHIIAGAHHADAITRGVWSALEDAGVQVGKVVHVYVLRAV